MRSHASLAEHAAEFGLSGYVGRDPASCLTCANCRVGHDASHAGLTGDSRLRTNEECV